ncbi:SDR family NAD(P)-dependent oxidoreductase [Candidatus Mycobacterium wuenschmannii]|uniref:SDR family NAD(P)-dependent oxidoreductase n=1 Tax=Candidatus Mycobacterium wuenschmannii TaxID=3027808 RepID=A0ABY8W3Z6_9MYCO|nr:SDR family NAD(P)-dependent oxidoreductase [Candidatus Mycobacterium wuenschmannii]WIM90086.1 SDR family NAD(P)-dependent oxidoreductase [Candidatus Mycobacterium wuenschmannii]
MQLAVVTGASSGIGLELARLFAADNYDLVIVAEDDAIHSAAAELADGGITIEAVQQDMRDDGAVERVYDVVSQGGTRAPAAMAFNVGIGRTGRFIDGSAQRDLDIIDVNVRSTVHLAKLVLRDMAWRNQGQALFTSSVVAMMPGSHQTMYNASKSFIQSFAEGLHDEFRGTGVSVTSLMPGPTDTEFFRRNDMAGTVLARLPFKDDPADTARQGYLAMNRGQQKVVASSFTSKLMGAALRVLPDSLKAMGNRIFTIPLGK